MTIDPLKNALSNTSLVKNEEKSAREKLRATTDSFANQLEQMEKSADQARQWAQLMRLQMSRSNWLDDDEENLEEGGAPFMPQGLGSIPTSANIGRQNFDQLNRLTASFEQRGGLQRYQQQTDPIESAVARASEKYSIAPELIKAVIKTESAFDPQAVSPVGAQGLMQLMPGTAKELGVENPFDTEQNVMGGTRYLRMMLDKYDGDLDSALAAYNWGPGNLDRRGAEAMPEETRNYLTRVKKHLEDFSG